MTNTFETIQNLETITGGYDRAVATRTMQDWGDTGARVGAITGAVAGAGVGLTTGPAALYVSPTLGAAGAFTGSLAGGMVGAAAGYTYGALKTFGK